MKKYQETIYYQLSEWAKQSKKKIMMIRYLNHSITRLMYLSYTALILWTSYQKKWEMLGRIVFIPGIAFVLLSFARERYNAKRPYEIWDYEPIINRMGEGQSFPSRHVFSAAIISMVFIKYYPSIGFAYLYASIILAIARVIGGVHFVKDVFVGWVFGVLSGVVLFFL